jgi:hypothetical protein
VIVCCELWNEDFQESSHNVHSYDFNWQLPTLLIWSDCCGEWIHDDTRSCTTWCTLSLFVFIIFASSSSGSSSGSSYSYSYLEKVFQISIFSRSSQALRHSIGEAPKIPTYLQLTRIDPRSTSRIIVCLPPCAQELRWYNGSSAKDGQQREDLGWHGKIKSAFISSSTPIPTFAGILSLTALHCWIHCLLFCSALGIFLLSFYSIFFSRKKTSSRGSNHDSTKYEAVRSSEKHTKTSKLVETLLYFTLL